MAILPNGANGGKWQNISAVEFRYIAGLPWLLYVVDKQATYPNILIFRTLITFYLLYFHFWSL